jgi:hypothetical protein
VLLLLMPFALTFCAACIEKYPYGGSARTAQYLAPAICLLAGCGLAAVLARVFRMPRYRNAVLVAALLMAVLPVVGMSMDIVHPYKSKRVLLGREAVVDVARRTGPRDRWIIFNAREPVDYAPYLGHWRGVGGQFVFDVSRYCTVDLDWAPRPETIRPVPGQRIWLLAFRAIREKAVFPDELWNAYVATMAENLGPPKLESHMVSNRADKIQSVEVALFEP